MRHAGSARGEARLLAFIAADLEKHLAREGSVQTACAALRRLGVSLTISIVTAPGDAPPRVTLPGSGPGVPQWSEEDTEILRSLGIASDANETPNGSAPEPGGRQPR